MGSHLSSGTRSARTPVLLWERPLTSALHQESQAVWEPGFCPHHPQPRPPDVPTMEKGGPPIRPKVHSLSQLVLGSAVLVGEREDASVSRGGREGVTSTVPAVMPGVTGCLPD